MIMLPSKEILQANLNDALNAFKATAKAFDRAIALFGDGTDETLDNYTALGDAAHYLLQQMQQCIDLGYAVSLQTDYGTYAVRTLGNNIFNTDLIKFSSVKGSPLALEGVSLRYVKSATVEE